MSELTEQLRKDYQRKYDVLLTSSFMHNVWWLRVFDQEVRLIREMPYKDSMLMWDDLWKAVYEDSGPLHLEKENV